jgi:hypothetical protein
MRIGLIDVDYCGKFPNLALMKISAFHKGIGDEVEWYSPFAGRYDIVYVSKVFSWSADYLEYINAARVIRGGSGYNIVNRNGKEVWENQYGIETELPSEIEHIYPDYSLYPRLTKDTAFGFLLADVLVDADSAMLPPKKADTAEKLPIWTNFGADKKISYFAILTYWLVPTVWICSDNLPTARRM